ncbi:hypothetical protein [Agilicoccus flavus]|uniref:hypothetical protein n=1 Tax=Agilicoccus flavus TaxID=2775968 RepID=UPI001CF6FBEB|nr:hypothetical protein [Agilicoccus flavus]
MRSSPGGLFEADPSPARRPRRRGALVAGLILGLLLGAGGLVALVRTEWGAATIARPAPVPTVTATRAPDSSDGVAGPAGSTWPAACARVTEHSTAVLALLRQGADAASRLDAATLSGIVRQAEERNAALAADSATCRQLTGVG